MIDINEIWMSLIKSESTKQILGLRRIEIQEVFLQLVVPPRMHSVFWCAFREAFLLSLDHAKCWYFRKRGFLHAKTELSTIDARHKLILQSWIYVFNRSLENKKLYTTLGLVSPNAVIHGFTPYRLPLWNPFNFFCIWPLKHSTFWQSR